MFLIISPEKSPQCENIHMYSNDYSFARMISVTMICFNIGLGLMIHIYSHLYRHGYCKLSFSKIHNMDTDPSITLYVTSYLFTITFIATFMLFLLEISNRCRLHSSPANNALAERHGIFMGSICPSIGRF